MVDVDADGEQAGFFRVLYLAVNDVAVIVGLNDFDDFCAGGCETVDLLLFSHAVPENASCIGRALCEGQLSQLDSISRDYIPQPEADEAAGAADVEEAVRSIEDSASIIQPEMNFSIDLGPAEEPEAEVSLESTQPFTV